MMHGQNHFKFIQYGLHSLYEATVLAVGCTE